MRNSAKRPPFRSSWRLGTCIFIRFPTGQHKQKGRRETEEWGIPYHGSPWAEPPAKARPHGLTREDRTAQKSDDWLKRDFSSSKPLEKCVTDVTELKDSDGKLYVSAIFDCYDRAVLGLAMDTYR